MLNVSWLNTLTIKLFKLLKYILVDNIRNLITREQRLNTLYKEEWNTIKNIKDKIKEHNLIITKADKGKSIIIMEQHEYTQHIEEFIKENNYTLQ
jgi:hypothetical protein